MTGGNAVATPLLLGLAALRLRPPSEHQTDLQIGLPAIPEYQHPAQAAGVVPGPDYMDISVTKQPSDQKKTWTVGTLVYTRYSLLILFCWLLWGDFAWSMKERAVPPIVQLLFKKHGAPDTFVGIVVGSVPAIIAMILGPIISFRSDRHRGRWGRRIPYLFMPTPIAVFAMLGLAFCPVIGSWVHHLAGGYSPGENPLVLIFYALFWTLFAVASTIGNSVFGGLINDVVPEPVIGRFFGVDVVQVVCDRSSRPFTFSGSCFRAASLLLFCGLSQAGNSL